MLFESRFAVYGGYFECGVLSSPDPIRQVFANGVPRPLPGPSDRALPYDGDTPAVDHKGCEDSPVPLPIVAEFLLPEARPSGREPEQGAVVPMPKAAMKENHNTVPRQNEIGFAR